MNKEKNYPKLETPFERLRNGTKYVLSDKLVPNHSWFLTEPVDAVDKVDGTNVCVIIKDGEPIKAYNRTTEVELDDLGGFGRFITEGLQNAKKMDWLKDGVHYGELIGPRINTNRHQISYHLWIPFDWLRANCAFSDYPRNYTELSEWFKTLPSLFNRKMNLPNILAEGLVFYRQKTGARVKIRRDMFDWYQGLGHKQEHPNLTSACTNPTIVSPESTGRLATEYTT